MNDKPTKLSIEQSQVDIRREIQALQRHIAFESPDYVVIDVGLALCLIDFAIDALVSKQ